MGFTEYNAAGQAHVGTGTFAVLHTNTTVGNPPMAHSESCNSSIMAGEHPHTVPKLVERWCMLDNRLERRNGLLSVDRMEFAILTPERSVIVLKFLERRKDGLVEAYGSPREWCLATVPGGQQRNMKGRREGNIFVADKKQPHLPALLTGLPRDMEFEEGVCGGAPSQETLDALAIVDTWTKESPENAKVAPDIRELLELRPIVRNLWVQGLYTPITNLPAVFHLLGCMVMLELGQTKLSDEGLIEAAKIGANLTTVELTETKITDAGIIALARQCKNIQVLKIADTAMTDKGLIEIANNCRDLERLEISWTKVTEKGVNELIQKCKKLQFLDMRDIQLKKLPSELKNLPSGCELLVTEMPSDQKLAKAVTRLIEKGHQVTVDLEGKSSHDFRSEWEELGRQAAEKRAKKASNQVLANETEKSADSALTVQTRSRETQSTLSEGTYIPTCPRPSSPTASIKTTLSVRLAPDIKAREQEKTERRIIAQLKIIHNPESPQTRPFFYDMAKRAFLQLLEAARLLRSGVLPYDLKVSANLFGGASSAAPSAATHASATVNVLFNFAAERSGNIPAVGSLLQTVFQKCAERKVAMSNERMSRVLDMASETSGFFADTMARALTLLHLDEADHPEKEGSKWETVKDYLVYAREFAKGTGVDETMAETKVRLLATQYVSEIVFAMAGNDERFEQLLKPALESAMLPYQTDHLKIRPALQWHCEKHALTADANVLAPLCVWGQVDGAMPRDRLDPKIQEGKLRFIEQGVGMENIQQTMDELTSQFQLTFKQVKENMSEIKERFSTADEVLENALVHTGKEITGEIIKQMTQQIAEVNANNAELRDQNEKLLGEMAEMRAQLGQMAEMKAQLDAIMKMMQPLNKEKQ